MVRLRIQQVARETGLSEQVIRKWEERYGAVTPERLQNGYRVYSQAEVDRLRQIQNLVAKGLSVSQAVESLRPRTADTGNTAAQATLRGTSLETSFATIQPTTRDNLAERTFSGWIDDLLDAGATGQLQTIDALLQRSYATYGLHTFANRILIPFLRLVGEKWEAGEWTEDQEHLTTLRIRHFLVRCLAYVPSVANRQRTILLSCIPGERHDIMLQLVALEASHMDWTPAFLGPSPAPGAIENAVLRLNPKVVLLSISTSQPLTDTPDVLEWFSRLDKFAATTPETKYLLGGPRQLVDSLTEQLVEIQAVSNLQSLIGQLQNQST